MNKLQSTKLLGYWCTVRRSCQAGYHPDTRQTQLIVFLIFLWWATEVLLLACHRGGQVPWRELPPVSMIIILTGTWAERP